MKKVCVMLAAYNGESHIEEQLDSILNQKNVSVELVISLDLSNDNTLNIIRKYMAQYPNIQLLDYGEKFGSAGRNFFRLLMDVDFSQYSYVSFADQDDIWDSCKLERAITELDNNQCDAYSCNVTAFWKDGREKLILKSSPQVEFDYLFESSGPGCTFVIRKELAHDIKKSLIENISNIDDLWLHDWYCYAFARSHGYKWFIDDKPMMKYRQHDDNVVGANSGISSIINRAKVVLGGDAFDKVLLQAKFLGVDKKFPVSLITENSFFSYMKLASIAHKCRRKNIEKVIFFLAVLLFSFKRAKDE